jgi:hypothetical protein
MLAKTKPRMGKLRKKARRSEVGRISEKTAGFVR